MHMRGAKIINLGCLVIKRRQGGDQHVLASGVDRRDDDGLFKSVRVSGSKVVVSAIIFGL